MSVFVFLCFSRGHRYEVVNDLLLSCDTGSLSLLLLLDLSSAFDTISHDLLISRLSAVGILYLVLLFPGFLNTYMTDSFTSLLGILDPLLPP